MGGGEQREHLTSSRNGEMGEEVERVLAVPEAERWGICHVYMVKMKNQQRRSSR